MKYPRSRRAQQTNNTNLSQTAHKPLTNLPQIGPVATDHTMMQTICLPMTLSIKDLLNHPRVKEALREREQHYLDNLKWLDEDLDKKNKEEEDNLRIQEENISRIRSASEEIIPLSETSGPRFSEWLSDSESDSDSDSESDSESDISSMADDDDDTLSVLAMPPTPTPRSKSTEDDTIRPPSIKFQKNKNSLSEVDDSKWMIKKSAILGYFEDSKCENWKDHRKSFRTMVYTDPKYMDWSATQENGGCGPGYSLRKHGKHRVITAGANWLNWKNEKKEWQCDSLHFVKQIYDAMAKRQK